MADLRSSFLGLFDKRIYDVYLLPRDQLPPY